MISSKEKSLLSRAKKALEDGDTPNEELHDIIIELNRVITTSSSSSWWTIALKVLAYAIGLILGGALTTSCVTHIF